MLRFKIMRNPVRRFRSSTAANIVTLAALTAPIVIGAAAFAIDEGSLYVERREAQGITDLAAIAAATNVDKAQAAAQAAFTDNGLMKPGKSDDGPATPSVTTFPGHYDADPTLPSGERFKSGQKPYNAVKVTFAKTGQRYFSKAFFAAPRIATSAIATSRAQAAFSVGSRLARLDGGVVNAILGGLTGSEISLSVMDYDALLSSDIDLLTFFPGLATRLDLDAGTYADVLDADLTFAQFANALAGTDGVPARAKHAAQEIARDTASYSAPRFKLGKLFNLGPLAQTPLAVGVPGLTAKAGVLQTLTAAAAIANGENQVHLDLGASVPGLLNVGLDLAIGEPPQQSPWFTVGTGGEIVRTAQTRLRLVVQIGAGGLLGASVRLPLYLDLAYAEAKLAGISCPTGRPDSVTVDVDARPGVADLRIADMDATRLDDFRSPIPLRPAAIVSLPLIKVTGAAHAQIGNERFKPLSFDAGDIAGQTIKRVSTTNITHSLVGSLIGDLDLNVRVAGLGLGLPSLVTHTLASTLQSATPAVDALLVNLLSTLGVTIGEADVRVGGASCGRAVLVQ